MWLFANNMSWAMLLVGIVLLIVILMRRWSRYYRRNRRGKSQTTYPSARSTRVPVRSLSDAPDEILRWEVEMHDTARTLKGELDSKMRLLQILIRQADEVADRLETNLKAAAELRQDPPNQDQQPS